MRFTKHALAAIAAAVFISACSTEDPYAPVEALEIDNQFALDSLWSTSVGGGVGEFYSALSPAFASGTIYAAARDGDVFAIEAKTGDKIWNTDLSDEEERQ